MQHTHNIESTPADPRQFELAARRLADSMVFGMDDSIFHGPGIEYAQPRPYVPGDPIKTMDWKVTGRTGKFFVKEYQEPKRMPIYVMLDTSASMCVSSRHMSKYAWAVSIGTGVALAAQSRLRPVGLMGCGDRELHVEPTLSVERMMEWAHRLRRHGFRESTQLGQRLRQLAPSLRTRTMIIALTDLHDPDAIRSLKRIAQQHECVVFHLQDAAERGIRGSGFYRGSEAESGVRFIGHSWSNWDHAEEFRRELIRSGVAYVHLPTDEPILSKLRLFMQRRGAGGNGAR